MPEWGTEMELTFEFFTDSATLAAFDPKRLEHRAHDDVDWWCIDFLELDEVQSGAIALVGLGADGYSKTRITDGDLTSDERDYASEVVRGLGIEVVSGKLFVGPGECLPGDDSGLTPSDVRRGMLCEVVNGKYSADVYRIDWSDSPRWWTEDGPPPGDAPADLVVVIQLREGLFVALESEPRFDTWPDDFLFESSTRQIGPQPGMILTTTVYKGADGELGISKCGPRRYQATLVDYSQVAWQDRIQLKVLTVDHDIKQLTGEYSRTVKRASRGLTSRRWWPW